MLYQLSYTGKWKARIVPQAGTQRTREIEEPGRGGSSARAATANAHDDVDASLFGIGGQCRFDL
jgi:hypothetical protein